MVVIEVILRYILSLLRYGSRRSRLEVGMAEKDLLDLEFDEDTMKLMRQATSSPVKKAIVAAFVNGLDMRAITEQEEKTA